MSTHKTLTYYPSNFTLTLLDGFGNRKLKARSSNKKLKPYHSLSKMPAFARKQRVTYDKESLLEQIHQQKQKKYLINITNNQLLKNISKKKLKIERPTTSLLSKHKNASASSPLKREIQQLVLEIQQQNQEILRLKRSKKYNRYIELQTLKFTYLQEISQMKYKIRCFKHELKEKNRIKKQQRKRAKDIKVMNLAVQQRIDTENAVLSQKLDNMCIKIKDGMMKQISLKKEKERLQKEIYELQAKTGKIYINQQANSLKVQNEYQTQQIKVSPRKLSVIQNQQYFEQQQQYQDSSRNSSSNMSSNYELQYQLQAKQQHFQKDRTKNLSF